jgi:aspartate/methionine/tyrosine aminotransferase
LRVLKGDVLIPAPSWVSYAPQAHLCQRRVFWVAADPRDCHTLTTEALESARKKALSEGADPRILVVNTPSNPTGGVYTREVAEEIATWARGAGVTVLSDEIYAAIVHGPRPHVSPAKFYPEGTIVTGGLSKAFSAGGWRLGYALVPETDAGAAVYSALRALASEVWSSPSMPVQVAALAAYRPNADMTAYLTRCARLHGHAAGRLQRALTRMGVQCPAPAGAFYLYPDFAPFADKLGAQNITTSNELARHLLDACSIATLPGTGFGDAASALRLRLATSGLFGTGTALEDLLPKADALAADDPAGGAPLSLPRLDRAIEAFERFVDGLRG